MSPGIIVSTMASMAARLSPIVLERDVPLGRRCRRGRNTSTPTMSIGDSFSMASLAIFFCQTLPSAISEACMISTRPLLPSTFIDLMSQVDRQGLFDLGVLPAAGAEALRAADHDQAAALVVGVAADHLLLLLA